MKENFARFRDEEFHFLLVSEPFHQRLVNSLKQAFSELRHNPQQFLSSVLKGEGNPRQRIRMLQTGVAIAFSAYAAIFTLLIFVGLMSSNTTVIASVNKTDIDEPPPHIIPLTPTVKKASSKGASDLNAAGQNSRVGGSKNTRDAGHGGGGGGKNDPLPAAAGLPPRFSALQSVVMPNPDPPKLPNATLVMPATVFGDEQSIPKPKDRIGDPFGKLNTNSNGPGSGDTMGNSNGHGIGSGKGDGVGPGSEGSIGDGKFKPGCCGPGDFNNSIAEISSVSTRPVILYKEKARYTEEAREQRIQGAVVLKALFTADGRIEDVRVVRGLPMGLSEEAIKAAYKMRFRPATKNGQPVSVRMNIEFSFSIF